MQRNLVCTEWTEVKVDGEHLVLIVSTTEPEVRHIICDEIYKLKLDRPELMYCVRHEDGTLGIPCPEEYAEKIKVQLKPGHKWNKIQLAAT